MLPRLALARLLVAGLLALWIGQAVVAGRLTLRRTPLDPALLIGIISAVLSTLFAVNRDVAVFGAYLRYEGLLTILTYALLFWLIAQSLTSRDDAGALVHSLLAGAYVLSLLAILQWLLAGRLAGGAETAQSFGGWARADATFGNPALLGAYLAMLLPLAVEEAVGPGSPMRRALGANVAVAMGAAALLTFSRAAWVGGGVGVALTLLPRLRRSAAGTKPLASVAAGLVLAAAVTVAVSALPATVSTRMASLAAPLQGSGGTRVAIWRDTLRLVAARPLVGSGPDTFGLVYPDVRTWTSPGVMVDKAHADLLQVAATQGLLGMAASPLALGALFAAFWRGRGTPGAFALLGAVVAYELNVQVEFAWVPITAPFWMLAAAATCSWAGPEAGRGRVVTVGLSRAAKLLLAVVAGVLPLTITVLLAGAPLVADALSLQGLAAESRGDAPSARAWLSRARLLAPWESTYAAEAGDVALDVQPDGRPGPRADWSSARSDYLDAVRLGTDQPVVYERLAAADRATGRFAEADVADRTAQRLAGTP